MKIIPIKVEKAIKMKYKWIEWKLHNVCNHDCSFCLPENKDRSKYWYDLDTYKKYADKLAKMCEGNPYWVQLTGGEPTLYPDLLELLKHIHSLGAYTALISNGVRTLRWWTELRDARVLDTLTLTFHSEQTTDYKHIADVANLFHNEPVKVMVLITHTKDCIDLAFEAFEWLQNNVGCSVTLKAMTIGKYDIRSFYNEEQLKIINRTMTNGKVPGKKQTRVPYIYDINSILKVYYSDNTVKLQHSQHLQWEKITNFEGWSCDIGQDTMRIDRETVYRGVCGVGVTRHLDDDDLNFTKDSVVCSAKGCYCGVDINASKQLL